MVMDIINEQVQLTYDLFKKFKEWKSILTESGADKNTSTCCELMEMTAEVQHALFKLLHHFVHLGGFTTNQPTRTPRIHRTGTGTKSDSDVASARRLSPGRGVGDMNFIPDNMMTAESMDSSPQEGSTLSQPYPRNFTFGSPSNNNLRRRQLNSTAKPSRPNRPPRPCPPQIQRKATSSGTTKLSRPMPCSVSGPCPFNSCYMGGDASEASSESTHPAMRLHAWLSPLVTRYNELFTTARVTAMEQLQAQGRADYGRSQRIVFHTVQNCFSATRQYLRRFYPNTRGTSQCSPVHLTEDSENDPNADLALNAEQTNLLTTTVLRRLARKPLPECACATVDAERSCDWSTKPTSELNQSELTCLEELIREMCSLAWHLLMNKSTAVSAAHSSELTVWHVDIDRSARPGDSYNERCYRRSFDSEADARVVHHYVWPCLILLTRGPPRSAGHVTGSGLKMQAYVLVKGEACTRSPHGATSYTADVRLDVLHEPRDGQPRTGKGTLEPRSPWRY